MSDELRNAIARGHCVEDGDNVCRTLCKVCCDYADAAIALIRAEVLDEAAREVEKWQQVHFDDGGNMQVSNITSTIAAAIRALKENADDKT